jgi:two-component system response regulator FixJ
MEELSLDQIPIKRSGTHHDVKAANEIFIVDDDETVRDILSLILSLEGVAVTEFADGEAFLKRAREQQPVCVFLDVVMPGRSGIEILQELNALQFKAPVFLMSARDDTSTVVSGIKYGAHDFLRKPFDPYAAVRSVREAIDLHNARGKKTGIAEIKAKEAPSSVRLTRRETEVLAHVIQGMSSKDIAKSLGTAKRTVDFFRMGLLRKLGAKNTHELMRIVASWN